jgi:hypothetical protein
MASESKLEGKPGAGTRKGRPKLKWVDDVKLDLRNIGVKRWRTRTLGITEWATLMAEAKAKLRGL